MAEFRAGRQLLWRKAAIAGSLWAASEIVLGSFLHNARVPFKGEILTAIGIALLVACHRLWPERGLLWRAGLICAVMKSVSPGAAILGPMVAIAMEGLLAEAGLRLAGVNTAGYLLAGGLAMCWPIIHKLGSLLLFYGPDAAQAYLRGIEWLQARLEFSMGGLWGPLLALLALYFVAGTLAAAAGLRSGRRSGDAPAPAGQSLSGLLGRTRAPFTAHSLPALGLNLAFLVAILAAGRGLPPAALAAAAGIYAWLAARRYPRAAALLRHRGVWAGVLLASLTAGLILGSPQAGIYMALRAFVLTLAFAALGTELTNPAIRRALERRGAAVFFETLEYAFASLPGIVAALPAGRDFLRRPLAALGAAVARAPFLLDAEARPPVFIITGSHGGGKSELVAGLAALLRAAGKKPGGICAAGLWENGERSGFDLIDLASDRRVPLSRRGLAGAAVRAGEFGFYSEGLAAGEAALSSAGAAGADLIFVDEIGFLELEGRGWAPALERLLRGSRPAVLVVRDYLLEKVAARWELAPAAVLRAGAVSPDAAMKIIGRSLQRQEEKS